MTAKYLAVLRQGDDDSWWIDLPELPGIIGWGATEAEAIESLGDALRLLQEETGNDVFSELVANQRNTDRAALQASLGMKEKIVLIPTPMPG